MRSSLIMATYNGDRYIYKQLESIYKQDKQVDEVFIADDGSCDNTVNIISNFISKYNLVNWKLIINKKNKGWEKNFIDLMNYPTGEIIFYADQDDVWELNKVSKMMEVMEKNKEILCLAGKMKGIDATDKDFNIRSVSSCKKVICKNTGSLIKVNLDKYFMEDFYPGCVLAFRASLVDNIEKFKAKYFPDRQICRIANLLNGLYVIDEVMIKHRFHNYNAGGNIKQLNGNGSLEMRKDEILKDEIWLEEILDNKSLLADNRKIVLEARSIIRSRKNFLDRGNFANIILLFIRNTKLLKILLGDICYKVKINRMAGKIYKYFM